MITVMRKYLKGLQVLLFGVILAFIATSVFVWGKSGLGGDPAAGVAVVNGETIPVERYQQAYQMYVNRYSQMYPGQFTAEMAERIGLKQQVVNDLVQEALIVQRARAERLAATDEELNAQVQAIPAFHENGVFSMKRYEEFLKRRRVSAAMFEGDVRRELTRLKVESAVKSGVKVSDAEVDQMFAYRREKARAAWALVDLTPIVATQTASDAEIEAELKAHGDRFRRPERRRIQYVVLDPGEPALHGVPDADVQKYYSEHIAEFETSRQVRVAHVLVRVPETGGSDAEAKARSKAQDAVRRAKAGEDFAKIARELSEDPGSAGNGGEVGWVTKGQVAPQFETVAFGLKKGELAAEPVRTPFGYHAIKVLDIREAVRKPVKEVAPQIRAKIVMERLEKGAADKAAQVRPALLAATDFAAEAKRLGLKSRETVVARPDPARGPERPDAFREATFSLAAGGVSEPVKTPGGLVILKVVEHLPAAIPPLAEIKDDLATAVKRTKAEAIAAERAKQFSATARTGDFVALAKKEGLQAGETGQFSRAVPAERLALEAMLAALQLPVGAVSEPVKSPQGYYVVKTLERAPPDPADLAKEREKTARELLEAKRNAAWESWLAGSREKAKVELSDRFRS